MTQLTVEDLESQWETYEKLCNRFSDDSLNNLLEALGERLILCPASTRLEQVGSYPGGLIQHSLHVTANMRKLKKAYESDIQVNSILKVGLLHDLGKVGDTTNDYFVEQDSDWHREKLGQMYKYNEDLNKMSTSHRTLYLLQHFGVTLTKDEWIAIQLAQGSHFEENRFYVGHEPTLALLLQQAKQMSLHQKKT